ncbi:GNAT family protein [Paludicola sp. MB14-C6]|uniref:GNAT family N-acetyltransferase n=1 Tax=Paludihabitans sp. MB14-C6 TaxID=3070656 RepID=UPI0027DD85B7|nr:GNAT family protein [Paludicola sp. MB14-C6]WMJ22081.1 GNAT family protein [Paludicola sp. MB14-C6]
MAELFECFPSLQNETLIIRKMSDDDIDALSEIACNDNVYKYIPPFLYKKSRGNLLAAIRNLGGRDFDKKKLIIAGIYLCEEPDKLIGLAEMFDYKKRVNQITIGYRISELYWHRGIATNTVKLMIDYLCNDIGIQKLKAFVMPENVFSAKVLIKNGFIKEPNTVQEKNWGGKEIVDLNVFTYAVQ